MDSKIESELIELYDLVGNDIDNCNIKLEIDGIFEFISYSNKYFEENEPWNLAKTDKKTGKKIVTK